MLEGQVVSGGDPADRARSSRRRGQPGAKTSFGYKSFHSGRRTERAFISNYFWTHLVEGGQSGAPAELGNDPTASDSRQTHAGNSAERITDPYINLDFFWKRKKNFKSSTSTT